METLITQKSIEIFPLQEASQIGEVRRYAGHLADELQFTHIAMANLAIVVTECGTNLISRIMNFFYDKLTISILNVAINKEKKVLL